MADAPHDAPTPQPDEAPSAAATPPPTSKASPPEAEETAPSPRRRRFLRKRYLPLHLLLLVALLLAALHVAVDLATDRENILIDASVAKRGDSRDLVVLLHGYTLDASALDELRGVVEAELPDADILAPSYDSGIFSNIPPETIAEHLRRDIRFACYEQAQAGEAYERIFLIGHSLGALLIRKAYLDELESSLPVVGEAEAPDAEANWAARVDRLILMAGMNRGWSLEYKPRDMRRWRHLASRLTHWVGRLSWTGYLIRGAERGAPFVGDLRIQWIRTARHPDLDIAPAFQMLGLKDDVVSRADNMDLSAADNFTFIDVPAGHRSIITFPDTSAGNKRRAVFTELIAQRDTDALRALGREDLQRQMLAERDPTTQHIIFLMHGIRGGAFLNRG
ncbi:MAG: esterase/lipase family protein, partial [Phycisphaerales bacterium JB038]